jgi:hypothetical protein
LAGQRREGDVLILYCTHTLLYSYSTVLILSMDNDVKIIDPLTGDLIRRCLLIAHAIHSPFC